MLGIMCHYSFFLLCRYYYYYLRPVVGCNGLIMITNLLYEMQIGEWTKYAITLDLMNLLRGPTLIYLQYMDVETSLSSTLALVTTGKLLNCHRKEKGYCGVVGDSDSLTS